MFFCCLLALLIAGPLGLAASAPRGRAGGADCCRPQKTASRLWEASALLVLVGGGGLLLLAVTRPAQSQAFFHHICTYLPLTRTD